MDIPTANEINIYGSLDEKVACEHFLGKDIDRAEKLFHENSLMYVDDLMWMGPIAFRYYLKAAIRYIQSANSVADSAMINGLTGTLEFRREFESESLRVVAEELLSVCDYIIQNYEKFELEFSIYGDVRNRVIKLTEYFNDVLTN